MAELKTEVQPPSDIHHYRGADRGWNDPPSLAFSAGGSSAPRRRIDLRKRVGHDCVNTSLTPDQWLDNGSSTCVAFLGWNGLPLSPCPPGIAGLQLTSNSPSYGNGISPQCQNSHYTHQNGYQPGLVTPPHPGYHHSASMPDLQHPSEFDVHKHSSAHAGIPNASYWSTPSSGAATPLVQFQSMGQKETIEAHRISPVSSESNGPLFAQMGAFPSAVQTALSPHFIPQGGSPSSSPHSSGEFNSNTTKVIETLPQIGSHEAPQEAIAMSGVNQSSMESTAVAPGDSSTLGFTSGVLPPSPIVMPQTTPPPPKGLPPPSRGYTPSSRNNRYPTGQVIPTAPLPRLSPTPSPIPSNANRSFDSSDRGIYMQEAIHPTRSSSLPNLPESAPSSGAAVGPPPTGGYYAGRPSSAHSSRDRTPSPAGVDGPGSHQSQGISSEAEVIELTTKKLYSCASCCTGQAPDKVLGEIQRRIQIFEQQWKEKTMSPSVKTRMAELAIALENGQYDHADKIHRSLMADYPGEVTSWMVGIKKLINLSRDLRGR